MGIKKHILVIPGDGIGPEVTTWGKAVLEKIGENLATNSLSTKP
jgi:3-isopropylmalate dehydrogenase